MNWVSVIFNLIGGLGIFLYGMKTMSSGLQLVAGNRIKKFFALLTHNRVMGVMVGLSVTAIIQSSSATTVMVVGFINAGLMELSQAVGIVMGANIGTTITSWIIVIKITRFALPILGIGVGFYLFSKNKKVRNFGQIVLGFGMLFFGLKLMETAFYPLRADPQFLPFFAQFNADTIWQIVKCVFAGLVLTVVIQSSSATVGITIALANQGLLTYPAAAAMVLGENIGTTITMELASIGTNFNARRAAHFNALFNVIGVVYVILLFPWFIKIVDWAVPGAMDFVGPDGTKPYIAAHIAAGHSIFNIFNTILLAPCAGWLVRLAIWLVPGEKGTAEKHLEYIDYGFISTPPIAMEQAKKEVEKMASMVMDMLNWSEILLTGQKNDHDLEERLFKYENIIDTLQAEVSHFLAELLQSSPGGDVSEDIRRYLRIVDEYETVADYCELLTKYNIRKRESGLQFSSEAYANIIESYKSLREYLELCVPKRIEIKTTLLHEVDSKGKSIQKMIKRFRNEHIQRLNNKECDVLTGLLFNDVLTALQSIRSHAHNIAQAAAGMK
ncbi:MAG: Na/Pi cotransporter family protein [Desulfobacterales bacterium]|nr:Na/Pi cotransporter family protein [Desulfobacterales bacterium]MDD4072806.1 Na/Pi cotransporter family protein [Desulfobacterales bacterium]MDD4391716.1 Na/Pi cotransporter family protein [Desulfobacterales bacterium]